MIIEIKAKVLIIFYTRLSSLIPHVSIDRVEHVSHSTRDLG
jgi:hypothetical protein